MCRTEAPHPYVRGIIGFFALFHHPGLHCRRLESTGKALSLRRKGMSADAALMGVTMLESSSFRQRLSALASLSPLAA
jgi:hypothetical protein